MDNEATEKLRAGPGAGLPPAPRLVPDYELIRPIGKGSYGEVWLARSVTGIYRAVKIVSRSRFEDARPFEREFKGLLNYEPISRLHDSQVDVLHVGKNEQADCFYYVMELADDVHGGTEIDPNTYRPRTLHGELVQRGRLPLLECLRIGIELGKSLRDLHSHKLTHRDIKPSNIVFIRGQPRLVDVGLVTDLHMEQTFVGTAGFVAPEGPGEPNADIYSLGKVLYEIAFGRDRKEFPELPTDLRSWTESKDLLELNAVLLKACHHDPKQRYRIAEEMTADLELLLGGGSVSKKLAARRRRALAMKFAAAGTVIAMLVLGFVFQQQHSRETNRQRALQDVVAKGNRMLAEGDPGAALLFFAEGVRLARAGSPEDLENRIRCSATLAQCPRLEHARSVESPLRAACLSPQGTAMAGSTDDGAIIIWNLNTGEQVSRGIAHGSRVIALAFSPDGTRLATCGVDGWVRIWSVDPGHDLLLAIQHGEPVWCVAFSTDGWLVATGGGPESPTATEGSARVWDAKTGAPRTPLLHHSGRVAGMAFRADGPQLITASHDRKVRRWNAANGAPVGKVLTADAPVRSVEVVPGRDQFVVTTYDGAVRFWDCVTGETFSPAVERRIGVSRVGMVPMTGWLAIAGEDGTLTFHDPMTGRPTLVPYKMPSAIMDAHWSDDGRKLLAVHKDGWIRTWKVPEQLCARVISAGAPVQSMSLHPQHTCVAAAIGGSSSNWSAALWDLDTGVKRREFLHDSTPVLFVAISPDGHRVVTTGIDNMARLWEAETGESVCPPIAHLGPVWEAAFSPDGTKVVTACGETGPGGARVFQTVNGEDTGIWLRHESAVRSVDYSPRGDQIATGGGTEVGPGHARIWEANSGKPIGDWLKHEGNVLHVRFNPDGRLLATSSMDQTARLWDAKTGSPFAPPLKHSAGVRHVRFSPDSARVVTASFDRTALVWDVRTGMRLGPPMKHGAAVIDADFSPDGQWILTAAADGSSCVWSSRTGQPLTPMLPHFGPVTGMSFVTAGKTGTRVVTGSLDGKIRTWLLEPVAGTYESLFGIARVLSGRTLQQVN